jgi:hypothetical protein
MCTQANPCIVLGVFVVSVIAVIGCNTAAEPKEPLTVKLDQRGPYLILATREAETAYPAAIAAACELHPNAELLAFDPSDLDEVLVALRRIQPRYALVFVKPGELDVNFAWRWLTLTTQLDDDSFVDVRTGFITGDSPESAEAFVERIAAAVRGEVRLPGKIIDNLGPNTQAGKHEFHRSPGSFFLTSFARRFGLETISHGAEAYAEERPKSMDSAGLLHFGGHGHPDRIDDGLNGTQARQLALAPCVAFNGACYTGVTGRWFEQWTADGKVVERSVAPVDCFCLNLLANQVLAYLAALHPDHGIPVYQEMEYLAYSGASLGEIMKHTHDGVVLGFGGTLPVFESFADGSPSPQWTPSDVMLKGTAARVLFGDPAMVLGEVFVKPPFEVSLEQDESVLRVTAILSNAGLKSTFTDTYHADMAWDPNGFNDRALITVELPEGWQQVGDVEILSVEAGGKPLRSRLVGWGVEHDGDAWRLHLQLDVPTEAYMQSKLRTTGAKVELKVTR